MTSEDRISLTHWGPFRATVTDGRLTKAVPLPGSGADPDMIGAMPAMIHSDQRIDRPYVRRSYLEHGMAAGGQGRGREDFVPVDWETALDLVSGELSRVYRDHGPTSVFGGSYGWSSAGRFHHARTQIRRFLAAAGGFTDQISNYSWGAAHMILPHVVGSADAVSKAATAWQTIASDGDAVVAFGGLNPKNWRVTSGGAGHHHIPNEIEKARERGVKFVIVSPLVDDVPPGLDATLIRPRPNSDTAIILALAHEAVRTGRADRAFLDRFTVGADIFIDYLTGKEDGQPKTFEWAAGVSGLDLSELQALWETVRQGRVMLSAAWSLQRADHGEQPFWALIGLAAMLGQIGLPGGGFCFGYGSMNSVGVSARSGYVPSMPGLPNSGGMAIPVASFAEAFLNPGKEIAFNGRTVRYPNVRLVYWAGGNPFHHAQDLGRVEEAWQRPETVIVHEPWWTPAALRADIVLPATTTMERNDIGGTSRDPHVFAMPKLIEPVGEARNDFDIFCALADRLGCRAAYDEGLDEAGWLKRLWHGSEERGSREGVVVPDFEMLWAQGMWSVPLPDEPEVLLSDFRTDPDAHPLATPSGRIELYSETIAGFAYDDCPPHATWLEPAEWLGAAAEDELHLVTNQPAKQLHSQLYQAHEKAGPARVRINPQDAEKRRISEGQRVRLWNARGSCLGLAHIDDSLRPGVLVMPTGAWFEPGADGVEQNGNPNVLTADRRTSKLAQACAALSALVRIEGAGKPA